MGEAAGSDLVARAGGCAAAGFAAGLVKGRRQKNRGNAKGETVDEVGSTAGKPIVAEKQRLAREAGEGPAVQRLL